MGNDAVKNQESDDEEDQDVLDQISSASDEEETGLQAARSYNSLLRSLNANVQRSQPQRKKRKVEHGESKQEIAAEGELIDDVAEESEVGEDEDLEEEHEEEGDYSNINEEPSRSRTCLGRCISDTDRGRSFWTSHSRR